MENAPESPRRRAPAAERRAQILAAALGCFSAKGYHAATMDDLVEASGLSKGSLYWHFRSKEDVFLALFDATAEQVLGQWEALEAEELPALEVLQRLGSFSVETVGANPVLLGAWLEFFRHPLARERLARLYAETRSRLARTLRRGIECGDIARVDPAGAAAAVTGLFEGLYLQAMVDPAFDPRARWPAVWALARRGLEA